MSFDDDLVLVDGYSFDEASFLKQEIQTISTILHNNDPTSAKPILQQYLDKINSTIDEYKSKTTKHKHVAWTSDDQTILELYNRLVCHKDRIEIFLKLHQSTQPQLQSSSQQSTTSPPTPLSNFNEDELKQLKQELVDANDARQRLENELHLEKESKENIQQSLSQSQTELTTIREQHQKELEQISQTIPEPIIIEKIVEKPIEVEKVVEVEKIVEKEIEVQATFAAVHTGDSTDDDDKDEKFQETTTPTTENNDNNGPKWSYIDQSGRNKKYSTPKAVDYQQFHTQYIEQLLNEIDRLTLQSQKDEQTLLQQEEELNALRGDKLYYDILVKCKEDEINTLQDKCKEWEAYANAQEAEVNELSSILYDQIQAKRQEAALARKNNIAIIEATNENNNDGDDVAIIADVTTKTKPPPAKKDEPIESTEAETTTTSEPTTTTTVSTISDEEPLEKEWNETQFLCEEIDLIDTPIPFIEKYIPILQSLTQKYTNPTSAKAQRIKYHLQRLLTQKSTLEKMDKLIITAKEAQDQIGISQAAKEIADISKEVLISSQVEIETLKGQLATELDEKNQIQAQLDVEEQERRRLLDELHEERELKRIVKKRLEQAQTQMASLVEQNCELENKIEFCLMNHSIKHDSDSDE